jgi:hypothetical protein
MSIILHTINSHKVIPDPLPNADPRPVLGAAICPAAYGPIFIIAKRESGKTVVIDYIIKHCASPKTHVIIFCSTLYNDDRWIQIRKSLEERGNPTEYFTSVYENGEDEIKNLVEMLSAEAKEREEKEFDQPEQNMRSADEWCEKIKNPHPEKLKKEKREKFLSPKYFIIFDDASSELKSPSLIKLIKESRHYRIKVILSSQYFHDLPKQSMTQVDIWILFAGLPEDKLKMLRERADLTLDDTTLWKAYKIATKKTSSESHPFFYINARHNEYRRNFNYKLEFRSLHDKN